MSLSPRRHLNRLTPIMLALSAMAGAMAEDKQPLPQPPPPANGQVGVLSSEQQAAWDAFVKQAGESGDRALSESLVKGEAGYVEALALVRKGEFVDARTAVEAALKACPIHPGAQRLRQDILSVLGVRNNVLQRALQDAYAQRNVRAQEEVVRLDNLMRAGDEKMQRADYAGAALDFDRVEVGLRAYPYDFNWGELPQQVNGRRLEAERNAREARLVREREDRQKGLEQVGQERDRAEAALKAKVDELVRRARVAYERKDYRRAETDAWYAYDLDRRREDARDLMLAARRAGHVQFDRQNTEDLLEGITRVHEKIHEELIPQNDLLVYPEDWQLRNQRKPREIGKKAEEEWVAALKERMEQSITFEFKENSLDDVIQLLRKVTGVNIVVAPAVAAAGTTGTVSLKVKDMRFADALTWVLQQTGLHMAMQNQAIYIDSKPIAGAASPRLYDITDLITPISDFPAPELGYALNTPAGGADGGAGGNLFGGGAGAGAPAAGGLDANAISQFITRSTGGDLAWSADRGTSIDVRGNTLFITQTPETHALVEQLLTNLRNLQALQVHCGIRLLDVRKGFFEEIGFDWQNNPTYLVGTGEGANGAPLVPGGTGSSASGYTRRNDNSAFNGSLFNVMPANRTSSNYTSNWNQPGSARGLVLDTAINPGSFLNTDQVNVVFSAVEEEADAQILEHPTVVGYNNQRVNAQFLQQYAYIHDYDIVGNGFDPQIRVLNVGTVIDVKPVVSADRKYVTLEVRPTSVILQGIFVETLNAPVILGDGNVRLFLGIADYPLELPNVAIRTLRSTVMIPDKGSLLLGGYTASLRQRTHTGIPFISHIPFLGRLFSRNGTYDENRRLFFLLNVQIHDLAETSAQH